MMEILRHVRGLDLPDCWIGAGFVRNVIWDALHDRPWSPSYGDVDVVYFDAEHSGAHDDGWIEARLAGAMPDVPWSVRNQARMHLANGDPPYADTADALRHWPETCTAVAVRETDLGIDVLAPFGVTDLITLTVNPTPAFATKMDLYRARIIAKQWAQHWPRLRLTGDVRTFGLIARRSQADPSR
ncbi:MAG TPA: nucleotidyltransferase family protein [Xanthobacteraceae bacterium]|nr:nucleotidyltransferase family protein [Xanthobacteraceae bacterium]